MDDAGRAGGNARRAGDNAKRYGGNGTGVEHSPLTLTEWLAHDFPSPDFLLGELISTTSRLLIIGPTGLGKTMLWLAVALAIVLGTGFLHWAARRACRVLYIDGEMSARLMRGRLLDAVRRAGAKDDALVDSLKRKFSGHASAQYPRGDKVDGRLHHEAWPF